MSGEIGATPQFAERLRQRIELQEFFIDGRLAKITISVGIAIWPKHGETLEELIKKANTAEHEAKTKGKNRVIFYISS